MLTLQLCTFPAMAGYAHEQHSHFSLNRCYLLCPQGHCQVLLCTLLGSSFISVPRFSCTACGDFDMSPAAVGCQRGSSAPAVWYDYWLCSMADEFGTSGGVAMATFCSCHNAVVERVEQLRAEPRAVYSLSEKSLAGAVRHWTFVQRGYASPAQHGADLFAGPMGMCPPCCGALLAAGEAAEVPREVTPAALPQPLSATLGVRPLPGDAAPISSDELADPAEPQVATLLGRGAALSSSDAGASASAVAQQPAGLRAAEDAAGGDRPMEQGSARKGIAAPFAAGQGLGQGPSGHAGVEELAAREGGGEAVRWGLSRLIGLSRPFRPVSVARPPR